MADRDRRTCGEGKRKENKEQTHAGEEAVEHRIGNEADETAQLEPANKDKHDSHNDGGDRNRRNGCRHERRSIWHSGRDMGQQRGQNGDRLRDLANGKGIPCFSSQRDINARHNAAQ